MRWNRWLGSVVLACATLTTAHLAMAQQAPQGASAVGAFAPSIMVGGETLRLNGRGLRERLFVKIYDMALYTPTGQVRDPEELYAGDKPFRLRFLSLRENDGGVLGKLLTGGMQKNAGPEKKTLTMRYSLEMIEIFSSQQEIPAGQTFHVDYVPGQGTRFYINESARGNAVMGHEFVPLLLGIWLGPHPANEGLKARLLGKSLPARGGSPSGAADVRG